MAQKIHRIIRRLVETNDPYQQAKQRFNEFALALFPKFKNLVDSSEKPFETAVRLAIAGNIIDLGVKCSLQLSEAEKIIEQTLTEPFDSADLNDFQQATENAKDILYLVETIDNGDDAPGTILESCCEEFRRRFNQADLIIAKGQGSFETLSDVDKNIFFILKVKCPVIAEHLDCPVGTLILRKNRIIKPGQLLEKR